MAERPILFSGEMVRAILAGDKTQTRRVVTRRTSQVGTGLYWDALEWSRCFADTGFGAWQYLHVGGPDDSMHRVRCRIGQPGDQLWVRETWQVNCPPSGWFYRADDVSGHIQCGWRPSIFMPRNASRIALEVTGVRVERVQAITEADAKAEGVARESDPDDCTADDAELNAECGYFPPRSYVDGYRNLWNSLNAKRGYGWDVNPWVWVIDFRRSAPPLTGTPNNATESD